MCGHMPEYILPCCVLPSNPYGRPFRKLDGRFDRDRRQGKGGGRGGGGGPFRGGERGGGGGKNQSGWYKVTVCIITVTPGSQRNHFVIYKEIIFCFMYVWQIPHGRKYDKKWLLPALQNICSVPYHPVQVRLSTYNY